MHSDPEIRHPRRALLLLACLSVIGVATGETRLSRAIAEPAPAGDTCHVADYKVFTPYAIGLHCTARPATLPVTGELVETTDAAVTPVSSNMSVTVPAISRDWLIVSWPASSATALQPKHSYSLSLRYSSDTRPLLEEGGASAHSLSPAPLVVAIDTSETVTLSAAAFSRPLDFRVISHLAFTDDAGAFALLRLNPARPGDLSHTLRPCPVPIRDPPNKSYAVDAECSQLSASVGRMPTAEDLAKLDLGLVGVLNLRLRTLPGTPITPVSIPVRDVFGGQPSFDPKSRFARQAAPADRDAAHLYVNANYTAGVGSAPAWTLNAKYSPVLLLYRRWTLGPFVSADVGNNAISGQTYANTINAGVVAQTVVRPGNALPLLVVRPGILYETDRQFDRDNLLATIDTQQFFAGFYNTQQNQTFRQYGQLLRLHSAAQLSDVKTPAFGYGFDTHLGVEAGGSVDEEVVHASAGAAVAVLPQYGIFRVVPRLHGLIQISRLSLDESLAARYLVATEETALQSRTDSLLLEKVHGWKALSTFTGSYALDVQGNLNLSVIYQTGFSPPDYERVNAVQAGLTIKF